MTTSQRHKTELKWHRRLMGIAVLVGIALGTYLAVWRPDLPMAQQPTGQEGPFRNGWGVPKIGELSESPQVIRQTQDHTAWRLFYATNREVVENSYRRLKLGDRARELNFGLATVQIPTSHQRGIREPEKKWLPFHPQTLREGIRVRSSRLVEESILVRGIESTMARMTNPEILVVVHGYNVAHNEALTRTVQIAHDLPFKGAVLSFTWPSAGTLEGYFQDANNAEYSKSDFADLVHLLKIALPEETRIHILAHSMGNRVVLGGLTRLASSQETVGDCALTNLILAAPDVGHTEFETQLNRITPLVDQVTLYTSVRDGALVLSHAFHREARAGQRHVALDRADLDTIDVSSVDTGLLGHSYYGSSEAVLNDLYHLLATGRKPGAIDWLELRNTSRSGVYWVFTQLPPTTPFFTAYRFNPPPEPDRR